MKTREELEAIAREIVEAVFGPDYETLLWDNSEKLQSLFVKALTRVQNEALNAVLPSLEEIKEQAKHDDSDGYFGWLNCYEWLRANMKSAPQPTKLTEAEFEDLDLESKPLGKK